MLSNNDDKENNPKSINTLTIHKGPLHGHKNPLNWSCQITEMVVSVADSVGQLDRCEEIRRLKIHFPGLDVIKSKIMSVSAGLCGFAPQSCVNATKQRAGPGGKLDAGKAVLLVPTTDFP